MRTITCILAGLLCAAIVWAQSAPTTNEPAATEPTASESATSVPVLAPQVHWHENGLEAAQTEAKAADKLLLVVYFDPESPTWLSWQERALNLRAVREYLAGFEAARVDVTTEPGKKLLAQASKSDRTPLTQVLDAKGQVLDSFTGALVPPDALKARLNASLQLKEALAADQSKPENVWNAIQARLKLSTKDQAAEPAEALLKSGKLPAGVTAAQVELVIGQALQTAKPDASKTHLEKALADGKSDPLAGGKAIILLAQAAEMAKDYKTAQSLYQRYITEFPGGPDAGSACYGKAVLEIGVLDDRGAARKTLSEFVAKFPDDPAVVKAKRLLEDITPASKPVATPATPTPTSGRAWPFEPTTGPAVPTTPKPEN